MIAKRIADNAVIIYNTSGSYYYVSGDEASFISPHFDNRDDAVAWYEHMSKFVPPSKETGFVLGLKKMLRNMLEDGIEWMNSESLLCIEDHNRSYIVSCKGISKKILKSFNIHTTPLIEEYLDILRGVVEFRGDNLEDFLNFIQYAIEEAEQRC